MLQNYSKSQRLVRLLILPIWVYVGFVIADTLATGVVWLLVAVHVPITSYNQAVVNAVYAAIIYVITIAIVIGAPWWLRKIKTSREEVGLTRLPSWTDILLAPAGLIIYFILSAIFILLAQHTLPGFDINQTQNVGFSHLTQRYEYILAFLTLVVVAPIAEETLFRGYLYGKLKNYVPIWVAMLVTSALFGFIHGAWNLAIDVFALSIILCVLREMTGNIWASILVHMMKNGIAFYILFINPTLLSILVK